MLSLVIAHLSTLYTEAEDIHEDDLFSLTLKCYGVSTSVHMHFGLYVHILIIITNRNSGFVWIAVSSCHFCILLGKGKMATFSK